ncbi:MAG: thioredoxin domain-containing protein, partial [Nitrosotalea sp.]
TILYNSMNLSSIAFHFGKPESEIISILKQSREKLYAVRAKRVRPGRDDKIMTSWNSLMITSFVKGYRVSGDEDFLYAVKNCIKFIEEKLTKNGELLHTYKDGQSKLKAYLDDYAYFVNALLDYFEVAPSKKYLDLATYYANYLLDHFWDENHKNFFFTADNHEKLIIRTKNIYDLSLPSGNSVAAGVMLRLYHLTQEKKYLDVSIKVMESLAVMAAENPFGFGQLLNSVYAYLQKPVEITMLNTMNTDVKSYLLKKFIPEAILVMISRKEDLEDLQGLQFFAGKEYDGTKTKVYVCRDFTCSLPLETVPDIEKLV